MPAWGVAGGGPMNDQQIDTLLAYLKSIQIPRDDCGVGEDDPLICPTGHLPADIQQEIDAAARKAVDDGDAATYGEALYNLEPGERCLRLRPLPHPRVELRRPRSHRPGRARLEPHRRRRRPALPQRGRPDRVRQVRVDPGRQVRHPGPGHGSHARASATCSPTQQIAAIVEYVRSL